jgi:hypothetical protein
VLGMLTAVVLFAACLKMLGAKEVISTSMETDGALAEWRAKLPGSQLIAWLIFVPTLITSLVLVCVFLMWATEGDMRPNVLRFAFGFGSLSAVSGYYLRKP